MLVTLIVLIFMADWRTTLTVGIVVPLALLFAFVCLRLKRHERQPAEHGGHRLRNYY